MRSKKLPTGIYKHHTGRLRIKIRNKKIYFDELCPKGITPAQASERRQRILVGAYIPYKNANRLDDFFELWKTKYAPRTKMDETIKLNCGVFGKHLLKPFGKKDLREIKPKDVSEFQNKLLESGKKTQTVKNITSLLAQIIDCAIHEELCEINPVRNVPKIKDTGNKQIGRPFLSFKELDRLLCYLQEHDFDMFLEVAFIYGTGLRGPSEPMAVIKDDIDWEKRMVSITKIINTRSNNPQNHTKTKIDRIVPIPADIMNFIEDKYRNSRYGGDTRICPGLFKDYGRRKFKPALQKAEIFRDDIVLYSLRHTFASHFVMRQAEAIRKAGGINDKAKLAIQVTLRDLMGHSSVDSTNIYMHLTEEFITGSTDILSEGMSWTRNKNADVIDLSKRISNIWNSNLPTI